MHKIAVITECDGEFCRVRVKRAGACGENCTACGGCRTTDTEITALNKIGARIGDNVVVEVDDKSALAAAAVTYLLPLAAFTAGGAAAAACGIAEQICVLTAAAMLCAGFVLARIISTKNKERFCPIITKIL